MYYHSRMVNTDASQRRIGAALEAWITGRRRDGSESVVVYAVTPPAGPDGSDGISFVPGSALDAVADGVARVPYRGDMVAPGAEFTVAGRTVDVHDYVAGTFVDIASSSCIRLTGNEDWRAFLEDADAARSEGAFVTQLSHPAVLLAGRHAIAGGTDAGPSTFVDAAGIRRFAPGGPARPGGDALIDTFGECIAPATLDAGRRGRPWLGRYLAACDLIRRKPLPDGRAIVGFGVELLPDGAADAVADAADPFLTRIGGDEFLVEDLATGRRLRTSRRAALAIDCLQTSSTAGHAQERLAQACSIRAGEARELLSTLSARLGFEPAHRAGVAA